MDDDVDPCTNFYEYACGSWLKKASLSPNEDKLDTYSRVKDDYNINMRRENMFLFSDPLKELVMMTKIPVHSNYI